MGSKPLGTPEQASSVVGLAQPVAAPLTRAAIFLVLAIKPGPEHRATIRSFCADLGSFCARWNFAISKRGLPASWDSAPTPGTALFGRRVPQSCTPSAKFAWTASCRFNTRRLALPHPRQAHGSVFRTRNANHGANRQRGHARGRSARIPLFRRSRSDRFCRRHGKS